MNSPPWFGAEREYLDEQEGEVFASTRYWTKGSKVLWTSLALPPSWSEPFTVSNTRSNNAKGREHFERSGFTISEGTQVFNVAVIVNRG